MAKAKWTLPAREDLKEIGLYIGRKEHRPSIAANILREIKAMVTPKRLRVDP